MSSKALSWTVFPDLSGSRALEHAGSWEDMIEMLSGERAKTKSDCRLISMCAFGRTKTAKMSLRHDANVLHISGVIVEHDAGQVSIDQAVTMLERAGVKGVAYTTPSHTPSAPRWRVVVPTSEPMPAHAHGALVARVNGALGGALAGESFTLSQAYFFGRVDDAAEFRLLTTFLDPEEGSFVDQLDELDEIAIGKPTTAAAVAGAEPIEQGPPSESIFAASVARLGRKLRSGDGRRELLKAYIASLSARMWRPGEVSLLVEALQARYFDPNDPPNEYRLDELIQWAAARDIRPVFRAPEPPQDTESAGVAAKPGNVTTAAIEPFPGRIADMAAWILAGAYKPQPTLSLYGAVIGMAAVIGNLYHYDDGTRLNLYGIGVGPTGIGKDRIGKSIAKLCAEAGVTRLDGAASGQGLEDAIFDTADYPVVMLSIDEAGHVLQAVSDAKGAPYLHELERLLLRLYTDSNDGFLSPRAKAKQQGKAAPPRQPVKSPYLCMWGGTTGAKLAQAVTSMQVMNGFLPRCLFAVADSTVQDREDEFKAPPLPASILCGLLPSGGLVVGHGRPKGGLIGVDAKAARLGAEVRRQMNARLGVLPEESIERALLSRAWLKMRRVAGVAAVCENPLSPMVFERHLEWASRLVQSSDSALVDYAGRNIHDDIIVQRAEAIAALAKRIAAAKDERICRGHREWALLASGWVPHSILLRYSKLSAKDFGAAIDHACQAGDVLARDFAGNVATERLIRAYKGHE